MIVSLDSALLQLYGFLDAAGEGMGFGFFCWGLVAMRSVVLETGEWWLKSSERGLKSGEVTLGSSE